MGGLVELLGIERGSNTEGDTRAEEDVVCDGGNTAVVDLGLKNALDVFKILAKSPEIIP